MTSTQVQYWVVTEYHSLGSLHSYLTEHVLTPAECLTFCLSISRGLQHLHCEIIGTCRFGDQVKPAVAHRDMKSSNILIASAGFCIICDFGLSITAGETMDSNGDNKCGTRRYMPPEMFDDTFRGNIFSRFI